MRRGCRRQLAAPSVRGLTLTKEMCEMLPHACVGWPWRAVDDEHGGVLQKHVDKQTRKKHMQVQCCRPHTHIPSVFRNTRSFDKNSRGNENARKNQNVFEVTGHK